MSPFCKWEDRLRDTPKVKWLSENQNQDMNQAPPIPKSVFATCCWLPVINEWTSHVLCFPIVTPLWVGSYSSVGICSLWFSSGTVVCLALKVTTFLLKGLVWKGASPRFFDSLKVSLVKSIKQILSSSLKFKLVSLCVIFYFLWSESLWHFGDEAWRQSDPIPHPYPDECLNPFVGTPV